MQFRYLFVMAFVLSLVLGSCGKPSQPSVPESINFTPTASVTNTSQDIPTDIPPPVMENPEYVLDLLLDYTQKRASVVATIKYQNKSGQEMSDLVLAVEPNLWVDCFSLNEIRVDDQVSTAYLLEGQRLELTHALAPMDTVSISISYTLALPLIDLDDKAAIIRTQVFGYTNRQLNLVDWYPFVVPYDPDQGWLLNEPATYGEHLVYDSANFEVTVNFAGEISPVIAASGMEVPVNTGKLYLLEKGRSFAISFSPEYLIKSQEVDGVTFLSYYFAGSALGGQAALDATVRAMQIFSQKFGPYPHTSLSIVEEDTAFSMEYDGLYFLEYPLYFGYSGAETDFLPTIAAHETAHQWWFGLVGSDQANQPWLDEALSTYSERLFNESISIEKGEWWYLSRISLAEDSNCPLDISIYGFYNFNCYYTESVYLRGALFLQALRERVGDQTFMDFLKDFAEQFAFRRASTRDFFTVLRQNSNADLTDIINDFFNEAY